MKRSTWGKVGAVIASVGLLSTFAVAAGAGTTTQDVTFTASQATSDKLYFGGSSFDQPFFDASIPAFMSEATNQHIVGASNVANADTNFQLYNTVGSTAGKKGVVGSLASSADNFILGATDVPMGTIVDDTQTHTLTCLDTYLLSGACSQADEAANLADYVQVPVVAGGVGLMYNESKINTLMGSTTIKGKKYPNPITLNATLTAEIYAGTITNWDDPRIATLNPKLCASSAHPTTAHPCTRSKVTSETISPVYRADGSGTSFIFTNYLNTAAPTAWKYTSGSSSGQEIFPTTSFPTSGVNPNAIGAQKNAGVALDTSTTPGAIGYVEYSYIIEQNTTAHPLPNALLINKSGKTVALSAATVTADVGSHVPTEVNGYVSNFSIVNEPGNTSWPISGFSWAVVPLDPHGRTAGGTSISANDALAVARYLDWAIQNGTTSVPGGQYFANQQGYTPFTAAMTTFARAQVDKLEYNGSVIL